MRTTAFAASGRRPFVTRALAPFALAPLTPLRRSPQLLARPCCEWLDPSRSCRSCRHSATAASASLSAAYRCGSRDAQRTTVPSIVRVVPPCGMSLASEKNGSGAARTSASTERMCTSRSCVVGGGVDSAMCSSDGSGGFFRVSSCGTAGKVYAGPLSRACSDTRAVCVLAFVCPWSVLVLLFLNLQLSVVAVVVVAVLLLLLLVVVVVVISAGACWSCHVTPRACVVRPAEPAKQGNDGGTASCRASISCDRVGASMRLMGLMAAPAVWWSGASVGCWYGINVALLCVCVGLRGVCPSVVSSTALFASGSSCGVVVLALDSRCSPGFCSCDVQRCWGGVVVVYETPVVVAVSAAAVVEDVAVGDAGDKRGRCLYT